MLKLSFCLCTTDQDDQESVQSGRGVCRICSRMDRKITKYEWLKKPSDDHDNTYQIYVILDAILSSKNS